MKAFTRSVCFIGVTCVLINCVFCNSAFSNTQNEASISKGIHKPLKNVAVYIVSSVSAIPQPIDRFSGAIPTTATPLEVIGRH